MYDNNGKPFVEPADQCSKCVHYKTGNCVFIQALAFGYAYLNNRQDFLIKDCYFFKKVGLSVVSDTSNVVDFKK